MTTIALKTAYLTGSVWNAVKKTFQGILIGIAISRQCEANRYVAEQMVRTGDWNKDDYYVILQDLNQKSIAQIEKEFGRA